MLEIPGGFHLESRWNSFHWNPSGIHLNSTGDMPFGLHFYGAHSRWNPPGTCGRQISPLKCGFLKLALVRVKVEFVLLQKFQYSMGDLPVLLKGFHEDEDVVQIDYD